MVARKVAAVSHKRVDIDKVHKPTAANLYMELACCHM